MQNLTDGDCTLGQARTLAGCRSPFFFTRNSVKRTGNAAFLRSHKGRRWEETRGLTHRPHNRYLYKDTARFLRLENKLVGSGKMSVVYEKLKKIKTIEIKLLELKWR